MQIKYKKMAIYLILAIFFVIIDRLLKIFVLNYLIDKKIQIIGDVLQLNLAKNYYIAFSLPLTGIILNILIVFIIVFLIYFWLTLIKKNQINVASLLTFLILGAISNMLDRFKYGYVIDYFDLKWFTVFNVADMMIVISLVFLIYRTQKNKNIMNNMEEK
jgi:signal peptidase II